MSTKKIKKILLGNGFHQFKIKPCKKGGTEITMGFIVSILSPNLFLVRYRGEINGSPEHLKQLGIYCDALKASKLDAQIKKFTGKCGDQTYSYWAIEVVW